MARSKIIYIICHNAPENPDPPHIIAAFTVKHEWKIWLDKCTHPYKDEFVSYRVKDNDWTETEQAECKIFHDDET